MTPSPAIRKARLPLLEMSPEGLFCPAGGFHIDPSRGVERALITHAHSDHARPGSHAYLTASHGTALLQLRLGSRVSIQGVPYGETFRCGEVLVSFHPAGHMLGAAQIRIEHQGEIWVVSGDYKRQADPTCAAFEVVPCHTFITESTFALPIYQWPDPLGVFAEMNAWWHHNQAQSCTSVVYAYSLGKAQRLLAGLSRDLGPVLVHPAIHDALPAYRHAGFPLPDALAATPARIQAARGETLIITPPGGRADATRLPGDYRTAAASGWMLVHAFRRRQSCDCAFVLSDHVDWPDLITTIRETGASRVFATHGYVAPLVRWLREHGLDAHPLEGHSRPETATAEDSAEDGPV